MRSVPENLFCPVLRAARLWPEAPALRWEGGELRYRELAAEVARGAGFFRAKNLRRGDRVGLLARNVPEAALVLWSGLCAGLSVVPLNFRWPRETLAGAVEQAGLRYLLAAEEFRSLAEQLPVPWGGLEGFSRGARPVSRLPEILPAEQEANVIFTSGSSGRPKGAVLPLRSHVFSAKGANRNLPLAPGEVWFASLPFHHVGGLAVLYRTALAGACAFLAPRFEPASLLEKIVSGGITHFSVVPVMLRRLLKEGFSSAHSRRLRGILLGGSGVPGDLVEEIAACGLPVRTTYGLTEAASQVTALPENAPPERLHTAGRLLPYRRLEIRDSAGKAVPPGTVGEIWISGPVLFSGYLGGKPLSSPAAWFATGDLGLLTEDGYLSVRGRKDDLIISGGENIFPAEIERQARGFPGISACAAVGVEDPEWGERPVLFVEAEDPGRFPLERFEAYLAENLPGLYRPRGVIVLRRLPRISIGKIDRRRLKRELPALLEKYGPVR